MWRCPGLDVTKLEHTAKSRQLVIYAAATSQTNLDPGALEHADAAGNEQNKHAHHCQSRTARSLLCMILSCICALPTSEGFVPAKAGRDCMLLVNSTLCNVKTESFSVA